MRNYKVGIGYEGCIFETYTTKAKNQTDAYYEALRKLNPEKGYNYIKIIPLSKKRGASAPDREC